MPRLTRKHYIRIGIGLLVLLLLIYGFWPDPVPVQTETVQRGSLQVIVEEEGETRAEDRYVISAPVAAFVRRINLEAGDGVVAGQVVAELEAPPPTMLDTRSRQEAEARAEAARAAVEQAQARAEVAIQEYERLRRLAAAEAATGQARDQAEAEAEQAVAARDAARAELEAARAALRSPGAQAVGTVVHSPVTGRVLSVQRESAGYVNPGEPLLEIGDTGRLEVVVDVLSQDAVQIHPGTRVLLDQWGGGYALEATVTSVAPQGHTAVSALGVEERRVPVVADLISPPDAWSTLGAGYRVLARFVIWESTDALQIPTSALFRTEEGWAVFVLENGRARRRSVDLGRQSGLAAQVVSGLPEGTEVIVHPSSDVADGVRVRARD